MFGVFNTYKWLFVGIGVILWSMSIWHVASTYTESSYTKDKLKLVQEKLDLREKQANEIAELSKKYQENLETLKPKITTINKEIQREILTNNVYHDCKSTDGVVQQYENKLDLQ
jgi:uncharacterized protein YlxW (UPF0749 family)